MQAWWAEEVPRTTRPRPHAKTTPPRGKPTTRAASRVSSKTPTRAQRVRTLPWRRAESTATIEELEDPPPPPEEPPPTKTCEQQTNDACCEHHDESLEDPDRDERRLAWSLPPAQTEVPAWRLMRDSLRRRPPAEATWPDRTPADTSWGWREADDSQWPAPEDDAPLDAFEAAAARLDAPLDRSGTNYESIIDMARRRLAESVADEANCEVPFQERPEMTLSRVAETLDAALYTFTKSYQAKEQREKEAQDAIDKERADDRKALEKEVREAHTLRLIEAAAAFEDIADAKVGLCCGDDCDSRYAKYPHFCDEPKAADPFATQEDFVATEPPHENLPSLSDASQSVQTELDLTLAMMQKRLGAGQNDKPFVGHDKTDLVVLVPKPPDAKPTDVMKIIEETPEAKEQREREEKRAAADKEFERRTEDAELRASRYMAEQAAAFGELGSPATDVDLHFATDEAIDRHLATEHCIMARQHLHCEDEPGPPVITPARDAFESSLHDRRIQLESTGFHRASNARTRLAEARKMREAMTNELCPHDAIPRR